MPLDKVDCTGKTLEIRLQNTITRPSKSTASSTSQLQSQPVANIVNQLNQNFNQSQGWRFVMQLTTTATGQPWSQP